MAKYVVAVYLRLSIEDTKVESMSIESQRLLLNKYAENLAEDVKIIEYVDNGYSGTNFERPAVQELLTDVQNYKINCILVKDFSRFGRNSIEVGYFTQQVFPLYNVRFISVSDQFDSAEHKGDTGGMEVAFKYLVNEYYSRDLSMKTKSAKYTKMRRGEYNAGNYPYGYISGEDGKPVIDESVADVVRMIFDLTIEGKSAPYITKVLFEKNIPTPAQHKAARGKTGYLNPDAKYWNPSAVRQLVANEIYMGMFVMCKQRVIDVGSKRTVKRDESEWIKISNHHPAIVSEEIFRKANETKLTFKKKTNRTHIYPLRKKIFCGCCNHAMRYRKNKMPVFLCEYTTADDTELCYQMIISEDDLHRSVFDIILKQTQKLSDNMAESYVAAVSNDPLSSIEMKISEFQQEKQHLYEMLVSEEITVDEFKQRKEQCNEEMRIYKQQYKTLQENANSITSENITKNKLLKIIKEVENADTLTQSLADTLIEKVFVYPDESVKVEWKVKEFEDVLL